MLQRAHEILRNYRTTCTYAIGVRVMKPFARVTAARVYLTFDRRWPAASYTGVDGSDG